MIEDIEKLEFQPVRDSVKSRTGKHLEKTRKKTYLTADEMAEFCGVSRSTYLRLEKDEEPLSLALCLLIDHLENFTSLKR